MRRVYIATMIKDPKKQLENYIKITGLRPYQIADLAKVPRVALYRFLSGTRDLKLAQWHNVERLINKA